MPKREKKIRGNHQPPKWALRLLQLYCNPELLEEIQGDLSEAFFDRMAKSGLWKAKLLYIADVIKFMKPFALESRKTHYPSANPMELITAYFKLSSRYLFKHKGFFSINILGLAIGIAACLVIFHYVRFELGSRRTSSARSAGRRGNRPRSTCRPSTPSGRRWRRRPRRRRTRGA
jgi:putative ABC transport system permease protein